MAFMMIALLADPHERPLCKDLDGLRPSLLKHPDIIHGEGL